MATPSKAKRVLSSMLEVTQPIISAVNGDAMGLGASIALMADISIMNETARIGDTHVRVGLVAGDGGTVIWPLLVGANHAALALSEELRERGIWVAAIRPPTVPQGTARLRITLSAAHSAEDVARLIEALHELAQ